jgi:small redox-active disulfide protein 2
MKVQVAGPGCARCESTEKVVKDALASLSKEAEVTKVTDYKDMARLGVRLTPAIVVDGQIVLSGRVPTLDEAKELLK